MTVRLGLSVHTLECEKLLSYHGSATSLILSFLGDKGACKMLHLLFLNTFVPLVCTVGAYRHGGLIRQKAILLQVPMH